jgi:hypothetical protein
MYIVYMFIYIYIYICIYVDILHSTVLRKFWGKWSWHFNWLKHVIFAIHRLRSRQRPISGPDCSSSSSPVQLPQTSAARLMQLVWKSKRSQVQILIIRYESNYKGNSHLTIGRSWKFQCWTEPSPLAIVCPFETLGYSNKAWAFCAEFVAICASRGGWSGATATSRRSLIQVERT